MAAAVAVAVAVAVAITIAVAKTVASGGGGCGFRGGGTNCQSLGAATDVAITPVTGGSLRRSHHTSHWGQPQM